MSKKAEDFTGKVFGIVHPVIRNGKTFRWWCYCECNKDLVFLVTTSDFRDYPKRNKTHIKSCFMCAKRSQIKHGLIRKVSGIKKRHPILGAYNRMIYSCYSGNPKYLKHYKEKGIAVCQEWREDKQKFFNWSFTNGWAKGLSLDRVNNDLGYSPENCRWTTGQVQANNKSDNVKVPYQGTTWTLFDLYSQIGGTLSINTVRRRLHDGWSPEDSFFKPHGYRFKRTLKDDN